MSRNGLAAKTNVLPHPPRTDFHQEAYVEQDIRPERHQRKDPEGFWENVGHFLNKAGIINLD